MIKKNILRKTQIALDDYLKEKTIETIRKKNKFQYRLLERKKNKK